MVEVRDRFAYQHHMKSQGQTAYMQDMQEATLPCPLGRTGFQFKSYKLRRMCDGLHLAAATREEGIAVGMEIISMALDLRSSIDEIWQRSNSNAQ